MTRASTPPSSPPAPNDRTLRGAVWLLYAEAAGVAAAAGFFGYEAATQRAVSTASAISSVAYLVIIAALLAVLGMMLSRRRRWARGPAIVFELLFLPIGYYMVGGGLAVVGIPVMLLGLVCAGLLFAPATRQALGIG